jgi:hypothetical protein
MSDVPVCVTSLVAAKLPNGDDRIGALAVRIAGMLKPPVDPNEQLTADQAAKAARWVAGHVDGVGALRAGGVLTENVLISKEEYLGLENTRDLVIRLFDRVNRAFNQYPNASNTFANERERFMIALLSIAAFFGKSGFDLPFANRFSDLASAIQDLNHGSSDLLKPPHGSQALTSQNHIARARVQLAVEALRASGRSTAIIIADMVKGFPSIDKLVRTISSRGQRPMSERIEDLLKKRYRASNWQAKMVYEIGTECIEHLKKQSNTALLIDFASDQLRAASAFADRIPSVW